MKKLCVMLVLTSGVCAASDAADPPPVPESVLACSRLEDPGERIRCYDSQIAPKKAAPPVAPPPASPGPSGAASPAAAPAPTATERPSKPATKPDTAPAIPEAQFGSDSMPPSAHSRSPKQKPITLLSSIKALRTVGPAQRYIISLANGQVWGQAGASDVTVFFRVGEDVRIEQGAFGSYHLFTSVTGSHWVQVTRIQ